MRPTEITLAIFEKYTPQELAETAAKMAQAQTDMETVEAEKKMSDSVFNERIKTHAQAVSELAQKYNKGGQTAQIGCTIRYDVPTIGKKSYWRMDREEMVEEHEMSLSEKQETLQFPLGSAPAEETTPTDPPEEPTVPKVAADETPADKPLITFKDFQGIARHIAKIGAEKQTEAIAEMVKNLWPRMMSQGQIVGPDGRVETVESPAIAEKLAKAWLELAVREATAPAPAEEVTRICPYPGCILFAEHDGAHEFPPNAEPGEKPTDTAQPQLQAEPEKKTRKRKHAPPPDAPPSQPGAPA